MPLGQETFWRSRSSNAINSGFSTDPDCKSCESSNQPPEVLMCKSNRCYWDRKYKEYLSWHDVAFIFCTLQKVLGNVHLLLTEYYVIIFEHLANFSLMKNQRVWRWLDAVQMVRKTCLNGKVLILKQKVVAVMNENNFQRNMLPNSISQRNSFATCCTSAPADLLLKCLNVQLHHFKINARRHPVQIWSSNSTNFFLTWKLWHWQCSRQSTNRYVALFEKYSINKGLPERKSF